MVKIVEARYGEQSRERVISAWPFKSSSGTTIYEVQLHSDGILSCNCPGWVVRRTRDCTHVKRKVSEAQLILDGKKSPVFEKMDGSQITPQIIVKEVVKEVPKIVEKVVEKIVIKEVPMAEPSVEVRTGRRLLRAEK